MLLNSWRQSMTAPDWCVTRFSYAVVAGDFIELHANRESEDHEWRPTFMPHMKMSSLTSVDYSKPSLRFLAGFAAQIAILDQPKRALRVLRNERLMHAYQAAVQREAKGAEERRAPSAGFADAIACRQNHRRLRNRHGRAADDLRGVRSSQRRRCAIHVKRS